MKRIDVIPTKLNADDAMVVITSISIGQHICHCPETLTHLKHLNQNRPFCSKRLLETIFKHESLNVMKHNIILLHDS